MPNYKRVFIQNDYVFITIVTNNRIPILTKNIDLLRQSIKNSKKFYDYEIFGIVILPDHIHMLIKPENIIEYPKIISRIKHYFSRNVDNYKANLSESKIKKREKGIWQRRFWEHTIRDENDLYKHLDYIHYNPVKHQYVKAVKNWQYSSFYKFTKMGFYELDWGNLKEIQHIKNLNLE